MRFRGESRKLNLRSQPQIGQTASLSEVLSHSALCSQNRNRGADLHLEWKLIINTSVKPLLNICFTLLGVSLFSCLVVGMDYSKSQFSHLENQHAGLYLLGLSKAAKWVLCVVRWPGLCFSTDARPTFISALPIPGCLLPQSFLEEMGSIPSCP